MPEQKNEMPKSNGSGRSFGPGNRKMGGGEKAKDFITKAFTVIFLAIILSLIFLTVPI